MRQDQQIVSVDFRDLIGKTLALSEVVDHRNQFRLDDTTWRLDGYEMRGEYVDRRRPRQMVLAYVTVQAWRDDSTPMVAVRAWKLLDVLDRHPWIYFGSTYLEHGYRKPFFMFDCPHHVQRMLDLEPVARDAALAAYLDAAREMCP